MKKFASGRFSMKNPDKYVGGRTPLYRSSWEFAFMKFCDESPSISKWASESIKIPYRHPFTGQYTCLLYTSPSPRDRQKSRMPSSA